MRAAQKIETRSDRRKRRNRQALIEAGHRVMAEKGIDIAAEQPKRWTTDMFEPVNVVITMGCGDSCPILPGRRYEEWVLPDPAGQPLDAIRPIRDEIEQRVQKLLNQLGVSAKRGE